MRRGEAPAGCMKEASETGKGTTSVAAEKRIRAAHSEPQALKRVRFDGLNGTTERRALPKPMQSGVCPQPLSRADLA